MRISVYVSPKSRGPEEQIPLLQLIEELSLAADEAGYAGIFLTEHHLTTHNPFQNSIQYASYLAAQCRQAYLGLCTVNPGLHHPLRLVEQCNLLDVLTKGRLVVGLGPGLFEHEYRAFGRDPGDRNQLFSEALDAMLKLWAFRDGDEPVDYKTPIDSGWTDRRVVPASYRKPHPLLARATLTESTLASIGARGWPAMVGIWDAAETKPKLRAYHDALDAADVDEQTKAEARAWTGTMKWIHVAETDAEADRELEGTYERSTMADGRVVSARPGMPARAVEDSGATVTGAGSADVQALRKRQTISGSPETVIAKLKEYEDAGVGQLMGLFLRDLDEAESVRRSFRLFTDEVLPHFQA